MIDFLKKYGLPFGLKKSVKAHATTGYSPSFKEAKSFLIFFTSEGNQKIATVKNLQNKLEKEGKTVKCLYLVMKDEDKPDVHLDSGMVRVLVEEFTLFGKIQNEKANKLLNQDFDFMIHADVSCSIYSDIILSRAKAKCRIGKYFEDHEAQYDMMIGVAGEKGISHLLDQVYHYAKRL